MTEKPQNPKKDLKKCPELTTTAEGRNVDRPVNRELCPVTQLFLHACSARDTALNRPFISRCIFPTLPKIPDLGESGRTESGLQRPKVAGPLCVGLFGLFSAPVAQHL